MTHTVLVAKYHDDEQDLSYEFLCSETTEECRAWFECDLCKDTPFEDEDYVERHGVEHRYLQGMWMAWSPQCLGVVHDDLHDAMTDLDITEPGAYEVNVVFEDDGESIRLSRLV